MEKVEKNKKIKLEDIASAGFGEFYRYKKIFI